jgi:hypothetical protein
MQEPGFYHEVNFKYFNIEVPTTCTCYRVYFYLMIAPHVSGIIITNLQEHKTTVTTASGNHYTVIGRVFTVKEYL